MLAAPTLGCHSVCATGITACLTNGGTLATAVMGIRTFIRTTQLNDRCGEVVSLDEIKRNGR